MGVGIEDAWQNGAAGRVVVLGGGLSEVFTQRDDLSARNSDIGFDSSDAGNDQGAFLHDKIKRPRIFFHRAAPYLTDASRQQFARQRRARNLAAVLEY